LGINLAKDCDTIIIFFGDGTTRGQQRDIDKTNDLMPK